MLFHKANQCSVFGDFLIMANLAPNTLSYSFKGKEYKLPLGHFDTREVGTASTQHAAHAGIIKGAIKYMDNQNISVNMNKLNTWGEFVTQAIDNGFSYISNG